MSYQRKYDEENECIFVSIPFFAATHLENASTSSSSQISQVLTISLLNWTKILKLRKISS